MVNSLPKAVTKVVEKYDLRYKDVATALPRVYDLTTATAIQSWVDENVANHRARSMNYRSDNGEFDDAVNQQTQQESASNHQSQTFRS